MHVLQLSCGLTDFSFCLLRYCSKTEYVRAIHFTREDTLFVATNNGHLYCCKFSSSLDVRWTQLVQVSEEAPIICMDIIAINSSLSLHMDDIIALGDGKGKVTILLLINGGSTPKMNMCFTWSAEKERQLLGVFWCKSLGCRLVYQFPYIFLQNLNFHLCPLKI